MHTRASVTHPVKRSIVDSYISIHIQRFLVSLVTPLAGPNSKCGHWGGVRPEPCSLGSRWQGSCRWGLGRPYLDLRRRRGTCYSVWVFWFSVSVFRLLLFFFGLCIWFKYLVKFLAAPCGPWEPSRVRLQISIDFSGSLGRLPWGLQDPLVNDQATFWVL